MVAELTGGRGIRHQASGDERFHDVIVEQAANPHLTRTLMPLRSLVQRYGGAVVGALLHHRGGAGPPARGGERAVVDSKALGKLYTSPVTLARFEPTPAPPTVATSVWSSTPSSAASAPQRP